MAISPRRRRKRIRRLLIAGIALLCAVLAALFWVKRRKAKPASAPAPMNTTGASIAQQTAAPTAPPTSVPTAVPSTAPTAVPTATPEAPSTPKPTLVLSPSKLARSLYQGSLAISEGQAKGALSLTYVNNGTDTLYALYLHLYPNTQVPGSLAIDAVSLNGIQAYYTLEGEGALLRIPLLNELRPGEAARVYLRFSVKIPKYGFGLALAGSNTLPLLCIFPTAAVYENGWITEATAEPSRVDYAPLADWRLLINSERTPTLTGGNMEKIAEGRYLCTAQAAVAELVLQ